MSSSRSFQNLAFRVHLKPAPRTQSESNAIFRALQNFGPIHLFKIARPEEASLTDVQDGILQDTTADLVFSNNTKSLDELRNKRSSQRFTVTANANIPSAEVKDPYNVRGLKNRKPELEARRFQCQVVFLKKEKDSAMMFDRLHTSEYSDVFAVDRNSSFGEILARTDCPSGLIHGLLPKIKDEHRKQQVDSGLGMAAVDDAAQRITDDEHEGQNTHSSRRMSFKHLDLNRLGDLQEAGSIEQSRNASVDEGQMGPTKYHDEFAEFRGFSLMRTYREAVQRDGNQVTRSSTEFQPFAR